MSHALLTAWKKTVRRCGDRCAVRQAVDGRGATFRELDARASAWLAEHAPRPGALAGRAVVFAMPNGTRWLEIFLGLMRAGALAVPLDAMEPTAAQRRTAESLHASHWWNGRKLVPLPQAKRWRDPECCLIKLTSGTTGRPRPLVFTAAQLLADARQVTAAMNIRPRDLNYAMIPFGHSYGLGNLTVPLIAQGIPLVCGTAPLPHAIAMDFARWKPTVFPGVPAVWRALAASDVTLKSLRLGVSAGAPLSADVARNFAARFGRRLHNFYGSSETGGIAYDASGTATLVGSVGRALRGVQLTALPRQRLRVSSAAVLTHGHRRRAGNDGVWIMPDRVTMDARGQLTLLGRRDTTVKLAGHRVSLGEVAARLRRLRGVRDVWVGVGTGAEPVLGAVVATHHRADRLRAALYADTVAWKIPKKLIVLRTLPTTARGKLDTQALIAMTFRSANAGHSKQRSLNLDEEFGATDVSPHVGNPIGADEK
jgi:acyl-coenzyme A synthetase/AMP-(fatty) acid ligase